jgi:hypothetical protein
MSAWKMAKPTIGILTRLKHLRIDRFRSQQPYRPPGRAIEKGRWRDRSTHGPKLQADLTAAFAAAHAALAGRTPDQVNGKAGVYLEIEAVKGAPLPDLGWPSKDIRLGAARETNGVQSGTLYGDLLYPLSDLGNLLLEARLESVKLTAPNGFPVTDPKNYGAITQAAIALPEIQNPHRPRAYCLAITNEDVSGEQPTSWSGALDQICGGTMPGDPEDTLPRRRHPPPKSRLRHPLDVRKQECRSRFPALRRLDRSGSRSRCPRHDCNPPGDRLVEGAAQRWQGKCEDSVQSGHLYRIGRTERRTIRRDCQPDRGPH